MEKRIIFQNLDSSVGVIIPAQEVVAQYGIEAIARKDVPANLPYKIVDISEIPSDRTFRSAWELPAGNAFDGVGSISNEFEVV